MSKKIYKVYLIKERSSKTIVYVGLTRQTLHKRFQQHVSRKPMITHGEHCIELVQESLLIEQAVALEELLRDQYAIKHSPNVTISKKVLCLNNGKVYDSARKAAKDLKLSYSKISLVCNGKRTHTKGYRFKFC